MLKWDGASLKPLWNETHSVELYNHTEDDAFVPPPPNGGEWERRDDYEDVNVATAAPKELLQTLAKKLRAVVGNGGRPQFIILMLGILR